MTVVFDAVTQSSQFTSVSAFTFLHTPVGTPMGVIIPIGAEGSATDVINGAVSYGGVAASRVTFAADTVGVPGAAWIYHLGTGIPTGAQVVSIAHTGSANSKAAACVTVTAARDTYVATSGRTFENQANPHVDLDSGSTEAQIYFALYTGATNPAGFGCLPSDTTGTVADFGTESWRWDRETNPTTSSRSVGYIVGSDHVAMVAAAIAEVAAAGAGATTPVKRPLRVPNPPDALSGITGLMTWVQQAARQLNQEGYISLFSGVNPNTSGFTGQPGNLLVNIGSDSTSTRLWLLAGGVVSIDTDNWKPVRIA